MGESPQARETLFALREAIARIEGKPDHAARLTAQGTADGSASVHLDGQHEKQDLFDTLMRDMLARGTLLELRGQKLQQAGSVTGLGLAMALMAADTKDPGRQRLLFIADQQVVREAGLAYAPGLLDFGLTSCALVHALPRRIEDALWLAEAALASRAFSTVLLEVHGNPKKFGLTESRRLSLKARATGGRLLTLRQAGEEEASSALLRLSVESAPAAARHLANGSLLGGSIGFPAFRVLAEKSRFPGQAELILEWNPYECRLCPVVDASSPGFRSPDTLPLLPPTRNRSDRTQALGPVMAFGPVFHRAS